MGGISTLSIFFNRGRIVKKCTCRLPWPVHGTSLPWTRILRWTCYRCVGLLPVEYEDKMINAKMSCSTKTTW